MKKNYLLIKTLVMMFTALLIMSCGGGGSSNGSALSSAKAITTYSILGPAVTGTIDENAKTISVTVPFGTPVTALIATFASTGTGVTVNGVSQTSGVTANNFTNPVAYVVTAEDGSKVTYIVSVTIALNPAKAITSFLFATPAATGTIDENAKKISVSLPFGTDVTALIATFATTGTSVMVSSTVQVSGSTANDFTNSVSYIVTAADSTTATYTVTVTVAATPSVIRLPKTGQTICYDSAGTTIACGNTGQNGELQFGVVWPGPRFGTNGDTTITDNLTGLIWAPNGNLMPSRDSGWDADGTANDGAVTWQHALDYVAKLNAENYLGHNDWRLPNRKEMKSLINYGQPDTTQWLNSQGFTNVQATFYWSSTSSAYNAIGAWRVDIHGGRVNNWFKTQYNPVWPVRAGQGTGAAAEQPKTGQTICYDSAGGVITCTNTGQDGEVQKGVAWPNPRFTNTDNSTPINGNIVLDQVTGLIWPKDGNAPGPVACAPAATKTWQGALDYITCLNSNIYLGYADWRLPDVNELESLLNAGQSNSATWLNAQGFTNVQGSYYWSSTSYIYSPEGAFAVDLYDGTLSNDSKIDNIYAWPVRGGQ